MRDKDKDEQDELQRLEAERAEQASIDRMYPKKRVTAAGDEDLRHNRRTGRLFQMSFRMQPKTRHLFSAVMRHHRPPSTVVLFEQMLIAYLKQFGELDENDIPSDAEAIDMFLKERDNRDAQ